MKRLFKREDLFAKGYASSDYLYDDKPSSGTIRGLAARFNIRPQDLKAFLIECRNSENRPIYLWEVFAKPNYQKDDSIYSEEI